MTLAKVNLALGIFIYYDIISMRAVFFKIGVSKNITWAANC